VTDGVLESLAPSLAHLEQFSITGCPRVTHVGIWAVLAHNDAGLRVLALEGLAARFVRSLPLPRLLHSPAPTRI
jgi:hypothetical protein